MRYEIQTINGLQGVASSLKQAIAIARDTPANCNGNAAILVKERKHGYPISGIQVQHGELMRHTMLLYPPNTKCRMYTAGEWVRECLGGGR